MSGSPKRSPAGSTLVVGLVGDPGLPYQLARDIATDLPEALREEVADEWDWRVVAIEHRFAADEQGQLALNDIVGSVVPRHRLDVAVCITDQPRRSGIRPANRPWLLVPQPRAALTSVSGGRPRLGGGRAEGEVLD